MPIKSCTSNGKRGYKYGDGTCYTYNDGDEASKKRAYDKAVKQGQAIIISQEKENKGKK